MVLGAGCKAPCSSSHFTEEEIECDLQCYWVIHRKSELKPTSIYLVALVVKNPPANAGDIKRCRFDPWVRKIPWGRAWQPTPAFLPGESHGQRSLTGYGPQGRKELDTTEAT